MAHSILEQNLKDAAKNAKNSGNPMLFLNRLEAIHPNWHNRTFAARGLGFLTFHWWVIETFKDARCPSLWTGGIHAFSAANVTSFGWPYNVTVRANAGDIASLADFSLAMERWHNDAHMAVGDAFGITNDMMNPAANSYYREFWRLHYFINGKFLAQLRRYDSSGSVSQKIARLEQNQHSNLYRI